MKEATGELNMTVVTIVLIGVIMAFFTTFWPVIKTKIQGTWNDIDKNTNVIKNNAKYNGTK